MRWTPSWLLDRRVVSVAAALILAAALTACSGNWAPAVVAVPVLAFTVYGMVALAWATGWVVLPLVTASVIAVGEISSALFYDHQADVPPDLRVSGMDEIGLDPRSVTILLPFIWILLLVTLAVRFWRSRASRA